VSSLRSNRAQDGICWLTFDRPERLNSFTVSDYRELRETLERCSTDDETRVVVLTGEGRAFSVGADFSLLDRSADDATADAGDEFFRLLDALAGFPKPLLAAVNGLAIGFGCTMLLYADVVVVAATARLRLPFTSLGIVPEAGSSALLPAQIRVPDAMWAVLSSDWIDAATAVQAGFAWRTCPDDQLIAETSAAASKIAAHDPAAVAATKRLINAWRRPAMERAIALELKEMQRLFNR
jgi:enoyl-CoA hydratase/carnithine racemase